MSENQAERTEPGTGGTHTPAREPTANGVGSEQTPQAQAAPIIAVAPTRERTVLGVGGPRRIPQPKTRAAERSMAEPPPEDGWEAASDAAAEVEPEKPALPERSVPIELVTPKVKVEPPVPSEASLAAAGLPRRRSRTWPALLVVVVAAGGAAYFFRARIPWMRTAIDRGSALIAESQPMAAPSPAPSPKPVPSPPAPTAEPSAARTTTPTD